MKILVETLKLNQDTNFYGVDENLTEEILSKDINEARSRAIQLKNERNPHKTRVIEYHNDEPDETRQPCKVIFEA